MTARIIDGKAIAAELRAAVAAETRRLAAAHGLVPGLAVILVGENPASKVYVRQQVARRRRSRHEAVRLIICRRRPAPTSCSALIGELNADPAVHGILVQLPLPPQIDASARHRRGRSGQGRRRLSSAQCRPAGVGTAGAGAVHAGRLHHARQGGACVAERARRGGDRPLQHRRQAAGAAAARRERHRHHRAFAHARSGRRCAAAPISCLPPSAVPNSSAATGSSPARPSSTSASTASPATAARSRIVGDVVFRGSRRSRRRDHAGAGRRRPDDDRVPARQYAARGLRRRDCRAGGVELSFRKPAAAIGNEQFALRRRNLQMRESLRASLARHDGSALPAEGDLVEHVGPNFPMSAPPPCRRARDRIRPRSRCPTAPTRSAIFSPLCARSRRAAVNSRRPKPSPWNSGRR